LGDRGDEWKRRFTEKMREANPYAGDVWTWVAMDPDTKLVVSWCVGNRDFLSVDKFISDLKGRLRNRVQLTTDGFRLYFHAIAGAFSDDIDYAVLMKLCGGNLQPGDTRTLPRSASVVKSIRRSATPTRNTSAPAM
jgi:hypothetical protein